MRVPAETASVAWLLARPATEVRYASIVAVLSEAGALRGRLLRRELSTMRPERVRSLASGLEQAMALYTEVPGDLALRVVKQWSRAASLFLEAT